MYQKQINISDNSISPFVTIVYLSYDIYISVIADIQC